MSRRELWSTDARDYRELTRMADEPIVIPREQMRLRYRIAGTYFAGLLVAVGLCALTGRRGVWVLFYWAVVTGVGAGAVALYRWWSRR